MSRCNSLPSLLLLLAVSVLGSVRAEPSINVNRLFRPRQSTTATASRRIFSDREIESFRRDGYLVVRAGRLLSRDLVERMSEEVSNIAATAKPFSKYFTMIERGVMFRENSYRAAAVHSQLPHAAAELMGMIRYENENDVDGTIATADLTGEAHNLRILRDVLLSKDIEETGCDWHVDDQGFWPESFHNFAHCESINVWIALDDMPAEYRGSMALAAGSHQVDWRDEAYESIGQDRNEDGGRTLQEWAEHVQELKKKGKSAFMTCSMEMERPDVKGKLEASRRVIDLRRGDIIFATRSLFHKTDDVTEAGQKFFKEKGIQTLSRYSIRYSPGVARIPVGWVTEWSYVTNKSVAGHSLDNIQAITKRPWYPKAWPRPDVDIDEQLDRLAVQDLDRAKLLVQEESAKFFSLTK